jgi:uncharacterized protein (DUF2384 family)
LAASGKYWIEWKIHICYNFTNGLFFGIHMRDKMQRKQASSGRSRSDDADAGSRHLPPAHKAEIEEMLAAATGKILQRIGAPSNRVAEVDELSRESALKAIPISGADILALIENEVSALSNQIKELESLRTQLDRLKENVRNVKEENIKPLAGVIAETEVVFGDKRRAMHFLSSPHSALGGRNPLEVISEEKGIKKVEDILGNIFYGLPA